jgi:hypothetical protein
MSQPSTLLAAKRNHPLLLAFSLGRSFACEWAHLVEFDKKAWHRAHLFPRTLDIGVLATHFTWTQVDLGAPRSRVSTCLWLAMAALISPVFDNK